jgi:hypothetical protein
MEQITKTQQAINLFKEKKYKESFKIFKTFKQTFNKDEIRLIELAYEGLTGKKSFYISIGISTDEAFKEAKDIIEIKYNKYLNK